METKPYSLQTRLSQIDAQLANLDLSPVKRTNLIAKRVGFMTQNQMVSKEAVSKQAELGVLQREKKRMTAKENKNERE